MARDSRASLLRKLVLWQNYRKVRALERRIVRSVDLLTTITEEDRTSLGGTLGEKRTLTLTPGMTMADIERAAIEAALRDTRGNRRKAAEMLDIGERTLYLRVLGSYPAA